MKISEIMPEYLHYIRFGRKNPVTPQTFESVRRRIVQIVKEWPDRQIESLTVKDVLQFKEDMLKRGCQLSSIQVMLCGLRALLRFAGEERGLMVLDPKAVKLPYVPRPPVRYLTSEEIDAVLSRVDPSTIFGLRLMALITTMLDSGMRICEALQMRRDSIKQTRVLVQGEQQVVHYADILGKGGKPGKVLFKEWSLIWIRKYLEARDDDHPALFVVHCIKKGEGVRPMTYQCARKALEWLSRKAGIDVLTHMLRRSGATKMWENGADLLAVQNFLRHKNPNVTQRYIGVSMTRLHVNHAVFNNFGLEKKYIPG